MGLGAPQRASAGLAEALHLRLGSADRVERRPGHSLSRSHDLRGLPASLEARAGGTWGPARRRTTALRRGPFPLAVQSPPARESDLVLCVHLGCLVPHRHRLPPGLADLSHRRAQGLPRRSPPDHGGVQQRRRPGAEPLCDRSRAGGRPPEAIARPGRRAGLDCRGSPHCVSRLPRSVGPATNPLRVVPYGLVYAGNSVALLWPLAIGGGGPGDRLPRAGARGFRAVRLRTRCGFDAMSQRKGLSEPGDPGQAGPDSEGKTSLFLSPATARKRCRSRAPARRS
jgi:hypothetical protein